MSTKVKFSVKKIARNSEDLASDFPDYEIVDHVQLNCTQVDSNNNKYYSLEIHKCSNGKYRLYSHYGRVKTGYDQGAFEIRGPGDEASIKAEFDSIIREKTTRKKEPYTKIEFVKSSVGSPKARLITHKVDAGSLPASVKTAPAAALSSIKLDPEVSRIIEQIYADSSSALQSFVNVSITKDGFETPIGVLSPRQIESGKQVLLDLKNAITKQQTADIKTLNSRFFSLIPHQFGHKITEADWIKTDVDLQRSSDLLQLMADSLQIGSAAFVDGTSEKFLQLGIKMSALNNKDSEFIDAEKYITSTISDHHGDIRAIKVRNVFRVELPHDRKRYDACPVGNEKVLFHGSRNCNIVGILKRGLLIAPPEAPVSGYAFGKGNYFADQSSKSINYSLKPFGKNPSGGNCFLFLSKVRLGKMYELEDGRYDADEECFRKGCNSTLGKKGRRLLHNEFITYKLEQNTLTHLVELSRPRGY